MRRLEPAIFVVALSVLMAGCATSALKMAPDRPDRPWAPATTTSGEIVPGEPGATSAAADYVLPSNTAVATVPPPAVAHARAYSLPELIDLAESNNPTTRIAWNDARKVALAAGIAESAYLPKLTASAVGAYQGSSGHSAALGSTVNGTGSASGIISAVSVQWLLFDFGERSAVVEAAKQASVISNIAFTAAHQQVIYNVALAFYADAAARARLTTARQSLKNAQDIQAAAEDRYKQQIGTVVEVAQARQTTAQAQLALVQATGGAQDAYLGLMSAMGVSPLTHIEVADVSGRKLAPAMAASVDSIISASLARRPDVLSAYAAQKASLAKVEAARAEFMPKLFLSATGAYNSQNLNLTALPSVSQLPSTVNISGSHFGGVILGGVTVPLYDGGVRDAALAQARAEADSASERLTRVQEDAVRQIALADNGVHTSLSAYSASEALVSAAQTTYDAAFEAYRGGVGSITDLTSAQTQLLQAKNASTDAYNAALSAAATLALATGALGAAPQ